MTPLTPHKAAPRRHWLSFVWLLGVAALAVSLAGAGWMMRSNAGPPPGAGSGGTASALVYCIGHVDIKDGVSFPYPAVPGRVVEVRVVEGQAVKAGEVLFRVDDRAPRKDVARAENAVAAARLDVEKAANAREKHAQLVLAQTQAVEAAQRAADAARIAYDHKRHLVTIKALNKEEADAAEQLLKQAEAVVRAEEARLAALKLDAGRIALEAKRAEADVTDKTLLLDRAKLALDECVVAAPADGSVLRLGVQKGDLLPPEAKSPPLIFCPAEPLLVRAEVEQEWAGRVQEGQAATLQDDTGNGSGPTWTGKVTRLGGWMAHRRSILPDPSQFHDVRTLECIITLDPNQAPLRIGQRVRVALGGP